jgi:hypothetical protein
MPNPRSAGSVAVACMYAQLVKPDVKGPMPKTRFAMPACRWIPLVSMCMERQHAGCMMPDGAEHVSGLPRKSRKDRDLLKIKIMKIEKLGDFNSFLIKLKESIRRLS